jgi:hypothetical protein
MAEPKDIARLIAVFQAAFPSWKPNELTPEIYFEDLKDIPSDELAAAVQMCRTEAGREFAPSIGVIRGAVAELRRQAAAVPTAFEAWGDLIRAGDGWTRTSSQEGDGWVIEKRPYKFLHPLVKEVGEMLGWPSRFPGDPDDEMADRAHFTKAYDAKLSNLMKREAMPEAVHGYIEASKTTDPIRKLSEGMRK